MVFIRTLPILAKYFPLDRTGNTGRNTSLRAPLGLIFDFFRSETIWGAKYRLIPSTESESREQTITSDSVAGLAQHLSLVWLRYNRFVQVEKRRNFTHVSSRSVVNAVF